MRSFAVAALAVAIFVTTMLVGYTQANASVHRAGCVGPLGAVVTHRHPYRYGY
jgi:hypothetical protein